MIARMWNIQLALLGAATALAACGTEQTPDTEVQGLNIQEPDPAPAEVDGEEEPSAEVAEQATTDSGASTRMDRPERLTPSELREDDTPWHLLPRSDWPLRKAAHEADCHSRTAEPVAC
jgi:hypothetical protein